MNIKYRATILNRNDIVGGAAIGAYALYQALNKHSAFETNFLCQFKDSNDQKVQICLSKEFYFFDRLINKLFIEPTIGSDYWALSNNKILNHDLIKNADIINLHQAHGHFISYPNLKNIAKKTPIVITMQDMWYLTGHCAFAYDCDKWQTGCQKCPKLKDYPQLKHDFAAFHWEKKKKIYKESNITFITTSLWLKKEAEKCPLIQDRPIHHVFCPRNLDLFQIRCAKTVRKMLAIPIDKNIILFGAADISDSRKGFRQFLNSINEKFVRDNNLFLVLIGADHFNIIATIPNWLPFKYFNNIYNDVFKGFIYNASDIFICPTFADNLPNMLIESLACGIPCVTFDVGGCGEIVINNKTGYLAKPFEFSDFLAGISKLIQDKKTCEQLGHNGRKLILDNFSQDICAKQYETIFKKIINNKS